MGDLSENFSFGEYLVTDTGIPNSPPNTAEEKILYLTMLIMQGIRDWCGALRITSGYRNEKVNRVIGGNKRSQHLLGEAVDFIPLEMPIDEVFKWIVEDSRIGYGQCILETRGEVKLIHISLPRWGRVNREALVSPKFGVYLPYTG